MPKSSAVSEAKSALEAKEPVPLIAVISLDRTRRERFTDRYIHRFFPESSGVESFDCREMSETALRALAGRADNLSLFASRKILVFRYADELNAAEAKSLAAFADNAAPETYVLIHASKLAEKSALYQYCRKRGQVVDFPDLKGPELKRWVRRECAHCGLTAVTDDAIELLCSLSEDDLDTLVHLVGLAALYVEDGALTSKELFALFRGALHVNDFEIAELLLDGKSARARLLLADSLHEGGNAFGLLAILARLTGQTAVTRLEMDAGSSLARIRESLGVSPWQFNKISNFARKNEPGSLRDRLARLLETDSRLKSRSVHIADILDGAVCG